jgi:hypothetical protein
MRRLSFGWILFLLPLAACGPNVTLVRKYLSSSPHRSVAVFPIDMAPKQKNYSSQTASMVETKMRRVGFIVTDHNQSGPLFKQAKLQNNSFDNAAAAADVGQQLGVQAVLVGLIDQSFEYTDKHPAVYEYDIRPIPTCCTNPNIPCNRSPVYDPMAQAYLDPCGPIHKKVLVQAASNARMSGMSIHLRLVDVGTKNILWESTTSDLQDINPLSSVADQLTDNLVNQMIEAYMKQNL